MNNKSGDDRYPNYENLLDDLYSLQKNLLTEEDLACRTTARCLPVLPMKMIIALKYPFLPKFSTARSMTSGS